MTPSKNDTAEFTQRTLTALMTAIADHKELGRQIEVMFLALAGANGLPSILPEPAV